MFKSKEECEKHPKRFAVLDEYNKFYNIKTTWKDVEKLLEQWTEPEITFPAGDPCLPRTFEVEWDHFGRSRAAVRNTLFYMFFKYMLTFYVSIRGGKASIHYLFNEDYQNPIKKYEKAIDLGAVIHYPHHFAGEYIMDFTYYILKHTLEHLLSEGSVSDCDFAISGRDRLNIKRDLTEPSEDLVGSTKFALDPKFKFCDYMPIFSFCCNPRFADIAWPTPNDWLRISKMYETNKCSNDFLVEQNTPWSEKKSVAVFRGSYTGSYADERNPRIKAGILSRKRPDILDAGVSSWKGKNRLRKTVKDSKPAKVRPELMITVDPLSHEEQEKYKYIIYIEGNVAAYRGAFLFGFGSVVLWVRPEKYFLWFEKCLKDGENCVFVKHDLSDLFAKIEFLRSNDAKAREIATAGRKFFDDYLSGECIRNYMRYTLNKIANQEK